MYPIIKILITDNVMTISNTAVYFNYDELPYGSIGYKNNGTSTATEENLNNYWKFVDEILQQSNLTKDDYVTLKSIQIDNDFYGISN
jgi:hypothetical protein